VNTSRHCIYLIRNPTRSVRSCSSSFSTASETLASIDAPELLPPTAEGIQDSPCAVPLHKLLPPETLCGPAAEAPAVSDHCPLDLDKESAPHRSQSCLKSPKLVGAQRH
jgi:hypothetical protein